MIDIRELKQKASVFKETTLSPKIEFVDSINFSNVRKKGLQSVKEVKEFSGNWKAIKKNDKLLIQIDNIVDGLDDEVSVPSTGWTWHTHPKGCPNIDDCSIIPPSANDFEVFAERHEDQHMVISEKRIYWVKALRKYSTVEVKLIYEFYKKLEEFFDDNSISHDEFDEIFALASKFGNFFKIYRFENKDVVIVND
mgnify:CR=1 FL=1